MQIGEQELPRSQHRPFDRLGLLDLDDHVRTGKHLGCVGNDGRPGRLVAEIVGADPLPCPGLHDDLVAVGNQFANAFGRQTDPPFEHLDLCRNSNSHDAHPSVDH